MKTFNSMLVRLFDKNMLKITERVTKREAPWLPNELRELMKLRDRAKSRYRKTNST